MPLTLDATVSGAAANSYQTVATAAAYFDRRLTADAWERADSVLQARALVQATDRLERLTYIGTKAVATQRLAMPRAGLVDRDGVALASTAIPTDFLEAHAELALAYLQALEAGEDPFGGDALAGVASVTLGPLSFSRPSGGGGDVDLPPVTRRIVARYAAATAGTFRLVRS